MRDSLLVQTLTALTPSERHELLYFLQSPLHNSGRHARSITALFTHLEALIHDDHLENLQAESVSASLFPERPYNQSFFSNLMSELLARVREFITQQYLKERSGQALQGIAMAQFYRMRNHPEQAAGALKRARTAPPSESDDKFEKALFRFWIEYEMFIQENQVNQRKGDLNLPAALQALTIFYAQKLLELSAALYQQQRLAPEVLSDWPDFIDPFRNMLAEKQHFSDDNVFVLDAALHLFEGEKGDPRETLTAFMELFSARESALTALVQKIAAAYVRSFLVLHDRTFQDAFRFRVYREHLEKGWLYHKGHNVSPSTFMNLINLALRAGEVDWTKHFISIHRNRIEDEQAIHYYLLGETILHFHLKEWETVFQLTQDIRRQARIIDVGLESLIRILEVKIAYETDPRSEQTAYLLSNFSKNLNRKKHQVNERHQLLDKHFVQIVRLLVKQNGKNTIAPADRKALAEFQERLNDPGFPVAERLWLTEKVGLVLRVYS